MNGVLEAGPRVRPLATLATGREGRIVDLRLATGERLTNESPLQQGTVVYVVEAASSGWLHVRINFREYSVPADLAQRVLVALDEEEPATDSVERAAHEVYAVLFSREGRVLWRVRVVRRDTGAVVHSLLFDKERDAQAHYDELRSDVAALEAPEFRAAYELP